MGKLIVIEGVSDVVGKSTQVKELYNKLCCEGYDVFYHHFPSYGEVSASLVEAYLAGEFGSKEELNAYAISSFYAMDRFCVYNAKLKKILDSDEKIVLLDRYTTSNLIYQGSFFEGKERDNFLEYISDYEYNKLGLRKPDLVIFLKMDKELANDLREKHNKSFDINEKDINFLDRVFYNSLYVANKYEFEVVECSKDGNLKSIDEISNNIYSIIKEYLLNNNK